MAKDLTEDLKSTIDFKNNYACPKCGYKNHEMGEIRCAGGHLSSWLNLGTEKFTYVSCLQCSYTEFFKRPVGSMHVVMDFLTG